jgi:hypothetical protein
MYGAAEGADMPERAENAAALPNRRGCPCSSDTLV